jgi:hypothetical protein
VNTEEKNSLSSKEATAIFGLLIPLPLLLLMEDAWEKFNSWDDFFAGGWANRDDELHGHWGKIKF